MSINSSLHFFLKYNKHYGDTEIDTMAEHIKVQKDMGSVIWGSFTISVKSNKFDKQIHTMEKQVQEGIPTYVFFYSREDSSMYVADFIEQFERYEISQGDESMNFIPSYYHDRVGVAPDPMKTKLTCKPYIRISNIRPLEFNYTKELFGNNDKDETVSDRLIKKHNFSLMYVHITDTLSSRLAESYMSYLVDPELVTENSGTATGNNTLPPPRSEFPRNLHPLKKVGRKTDYIGKAKNQQDIGYAGEIFAIKVLSNSLVEKGLKSLADKINHVSKSIGDGLGYDILTYDEQGNDIFVEVKTTTMGINSPFYMSASERQFASSHSNNFVLFRIYDFNLKSGIGDYYIINSNIDEEFEFEPNIYKVYR